MKIAKREDWKILQPLPEQHTTLQIDRQFTESEMEQIRIGFIPRDMQDKWFMYFDAGTFYMHRSWTGYCIYVADFTKIDDIYVIEKLRANRDESQYTRKDDALDASSFLRHVRNFLLKRN